MTDGPLDDRLPEPGWYPDPSGAPTLRWWNGVTWSESTHPLMPVPDQPVAVPPTVPDRSAQVWSPVAAPADPGLPAEGAPHRARRVLIVAVALVALVALGIAAVSTLLSGVGGRTAQLDTDAIERRIALDLSEQTAQRTTVTCPDSIAIEAGATFTCTATTSDGIDTTILVEQTSDQGDVVWTPSQ